MNNKVIAKRLKGFPDFFAQDVKLREYVINIFKEVFEKYGYEPLETPALELSEMMVGISGEEAEKQFYRFQDPGGRDVMLRYEVMTAMCRAVAENIDKIQFPYKRYQIQKVWRAENTQKGRYREFTQCDADTIGSDAMFCDAEFIQMGLEVVKRLGFDKYVARISNRKFLEAVSEYFKIPKEKFYDYCIALDKLKKTGEAGVIEDMVKRGIDSELAKKSLELLTSPINQGFDYNKTVSFFEDTLGTVEIGKQALSELKQIQKYLSDYKTPDSLYIFDPSLARGLASYTGPVWEFEVIDGEVGSIAGCGRYDNVIEKYIGRQIPATGGSFGIERICDIIKDRNMMKLWQTPTTVMICNFDAELESELIEIASKLRDQGVSVMIYPEITSIKNQIKYADTKQIPYIILYGQDEKTKGIVKVKDMLKREEKEVPMKEITKIFTK